MQATCEKAVPLYHGLKVTREQYLNLEDDGFMYDMIDGVLYMSPSSFFEHNKIIVNFTFLLRSYLVKYKLGELAIETDIFLPDGNDILKSDVSFILNENIDIIKGHIHGVPDLICEVLSDSTRKRDLGLKAERYLNNGVKEYWIIDPKNKAINLWCNNSNQWQKYSNAKLESKLLPSFIVNLKDLF